MNINVEILLNSFRNTINEQMLPALGSDYAGGSAAVIAWGLALLAQQWDQAVDNLVIENREIRNLFADARQVVASPRLAERLPELAVIAEKSFRVSDLVNQNEILNAALVELHEHVETLETGDARSMERRILVHLLDSAKRRRLNFG